MKFLIACGMMLSAAGLLAACANETNVNSRMNVQKPDSSTSGTEGACADVQGALPIPARAAALTDSPAVTTTTVYVDESV